MRMILVFAALLAAAPVFAAPASGAPPHDAAGHPDLSGVWTNASITKLTRSRSVTRLVLPEAEAKTMAAAQSRFLDADSAPTDPKAGAPAPGNPGGYNAFWLDPGRSFGR